MKKLTDASFEYQNSADSAKPGYLREKFLKQSPGCFTPKKARPDPEKLAEQLRSKELDGINVRTFRRRTG